MHGGLESGHNFGHMNTVGFNVEMVLMDFVVAKYTFLHFLLDVACFLLRKRLF